MDSKLIININNYMQTIVFINEYEILSKFKSESKI